MSDNKDHVLIFAGGEVASPPPDVRRGLGNAMKTATAKASEVAVSTLQENMRLFLKSLDTIISASPNDVGGFVLDEVEICSILGLCVGLISMHVMNGLAFVSGRFTILMLGAVGGATD